MSTEAMKRAGAQLANVAFNWAQQPGHALTSDDVVLLDKLRREWDAALSAQPPADPSALCLRLQAEADMWRANGDENLCVLLEEAIAAISQPPC